eukprot:Rhum_TRINITY_DN15221_c4_g1::Rhum_TRINITY_DN15221_c4_g1_i2::g.143698::m.143698
MRAACAGQLRRLDAAALQAENLVLDERQERRDDDCESLRLAGNGRQLVAQRLATTRGKQHEHVAVGHDRVHTLQLQGPEGLQTEALHHHLPQRRHPVVLIRPPPVLLEHVLRATLSRQQRAAPRHHVVPAGARTAALHGAADEAVVLRRRACTTGVRRQRLELLCADTRPVGYHHTIKGCGQPAALGVVRRPLTLRVCAHPVLLLRLEDLLHWCALHRVALLPVSTAAVLALLRRIRLLLLRRGLVLRGCSVLLRVVLLGRRLAVRRLWLLVRCGVLLLLRIGGSSVLLGRLAVRRLRLWLLRLLVLSLSLRLLHGLISRVAVLHLLGRRARRHGRSRNGGRRRRGRPAAVLGLHCSSELRLQLLLLLLQARDLLLHRREHTCVERILQVHGVAAVACRTQRFPQLHQTRPQLCDAVAVVAVHLRAVLRRCRFRWRRSNKRLLLLQWRLLLLLLLLRRQRHRCRRRRRRSRHRRLLQLHLHSLRLGNAAAAAAARRARRRHRRGTHAAQVAERRFAREHGGRAVQRRVRQRLCGGGGVACGRLVAVEVQALGGGVVACGRRRCGGVLRLWRRVVLLLLLLLQVLLLLLLLLLLVVLLLLLHTGSRRVRVRRVARRVCGERLDAVRRMLRLRKRLPQRCPVHVLLLRICLRRIRLLLLLLRLRNPRRRRHLLRLPRRDEQGGGELRGARGGVHVGGLRLEQERLPVVVEGDADLEARRVGEGKEGAHVLLLEALRPAVEHAPLVLVQAQVRHAQADARPAHPRRAARAALDVQPLLGGRELDVLAARVEVRKRLAELARLHAEAAPPQVAGLRLVGDLLRVGERVHLHDALVRGARRHAQLVGDDAQLHAHARQHVEVLKDARQVAARDPHADGVGGRVEAGGGVVCEQLCKEGGGEGGGEVHGAEGVHDAEDDACGAGLDEELLVDLGHAGDEAGDDPHLVLRDVQHNTRHGCSDGQRHFLSFFFFETRLALFFFFFFFFFLLSTRKPFFFLLFRNNNEVQIL